MSLNYNFDSYKSINIKLRQFWSTAKYIDSFYLLKSNGEREKSSKNNTDFNPNTNFNLWNFDLGFNWEFAPGSKATYFIEITYLMKITCLESLTIQVQKIYLNYL